MALQLARSFKASNREVKGCKPKKGGALVRFFLVKHVAPLHDIFPDHLKNAL